MHTKGESGVDPGVNYNSGAMCGSQFLQNCVPGVKNSNPSLGVWGQITIWKGTVFIHTLGAEKEKLYPWQHRTVTKDKYFKKM